MKIPDYELERIDGFIAIIDEIIDDKGYGYAYEATMANLKYLLKMINHTIEKETI